MAQVVFDEVVRDRETLIEVSEKSGVSTRTLYRLKAGRKPSRLVERALTGALGAVVLFPADEESAR